jgi:hypothetical protein
MRKRLHVEYPLFLLDFSETFSFSMDLRKKLIKIRPVGVDLFHADERTDTEMTILIVGLSNFANAPKKNFLKCFLFPALN